jgi:8-oxo-dGTP pyrophosphatase MutT (NUDIX family)
MTQFGGHEEYTTWDGEPVSRDRPHGATVVVASRSPQGWRYVLLHRGHHGRDWADDWAWTPPSGAGKPGENVAACAVRELHEETGIRAEPRAVVTTDTDWAVFALEVPWQTAVTIDGAEHDRFEWVSYAGACHRCRPAVLAATFVTACQALGAE